LLGKEVEPIEKKVFPQLTWKKVCQHDLVEYLSTIDKADQDPNKCSLSEDVIVAIILKGLPKEKTHSVPSWLTLIRITVQQARTTGTQSQREVFPLSWRHPSWRVARKSNFDS